jgi:DNA-binding MarR family transcriptional regulator
MTDVKLNNSPLSEDLSYLDEERIRQGIELLFFAYRDFTADADGMLAEHGFGRAHHRVVHFVGRNPGITVADLLTILQITKQSLSRVLKQLIVEGFVEQKKGKQDGRQRLLYLTTIGLDLEHKVSAPQRELVARAFAQAGPSAVSGFRDVLAGMIGEADREKVLSVETKVEP